MRKLRLNPLNPPALHMNEFLEVMDHKNKSCLNGRAYAAAGQIVASLHTMAVLQAYQTDLLKDLDKAFYKVQV